MELDNLVIISVSLNDLFGENNIYVLEHDDKNITFHFGIQNCITK